MRKVLIPIVAALVAVPAAAAKPPPRPLPPDQALPLITGPVTVDQTAAAPVSKDAALAAMATPGASTALAGGFPSAAAAVAAATGCASVTSRVSWGTWPYQRVLYENTYWCAVYGGSITSSSTTVTTDQTLCSRQNADRFTYSGGVGYSWVTVQANATWSCPIIGFIPYSVGGWIRTSYNAYGSSEIVGHS